MNGYATRRDCPACQRTFTCAIAFELHLFGRRSTGARCRTDDEMRKIGMGCKPDGAWMSRVVVGPKRLKLNHAPRPGHRGPFA